MDEAEDKLADKGLKYRTIGEGETVTTQIPASGASVPGGSTVILYLGDAQPAETGTVPNVAGQTYEAAKSMLEDAGFFMKATGATVYYGNTSTAESQSVSPGETAPTGTVIEVQFFDLIEDGAVELE